MPTLTHLEPPSALPGGELILHGTGLAPGMEVTVAGVPAATVYMRADRAVVRVPEEAPGGEVPVTLKGMHSNPLSVTLGTVLAENLHPVTNPAVDVHGNLYTTLSGSRGQATAVSVFRIGPRPGANGLHELRPFAREILNASGLAFGPDGLLYVSSRAEGIVYRVGHSGVAQVYAEGLGIATGIAFDSAGDLYVGDRSGTIFKIRQAAPGREQETFVFATLEPSIAFFHVAFDSNDTLYVAGPTTSSSQAIYAIDQAGEPRVFYRGLGRAQGMAFAPDDTLYVAASLGGDRGIVRLTQDGQASLAVSATNLVGLALLRDGRAALATRESVYGVALH